MFFSKVKYYLSLDSETTQGKKPMVAKSEIENLKKTICMSIVKKLNRYNEGME